MSPVVAGSGSGRPAHELVEVVDDHDRVIGVASRAQMRSGNLRHRAVFVAVVDSLGPLARLLVHRRSEHKDVWPGWWDLAVGGVVGIGESYGDAARRELAEEVGLAGGELRWLGGGRFEDADVRVVGQCYLAVHPGASTEPLAFPDGEVAEARWVTPDELRALRASERFLPDSLALLVPMLPDELAGFRF